MRYAMKHAIETDVDTFWKLFFDAEFALALAVESFGESTVREVVEHRTDEDGVLHRRVEYTPRIDMPTMLKKLFGDGSYTEIGRYEPATNRFVAQYLPRVGASKFMLNAEISVEPLEGKRCERLVVMENVVKVFGIGKAIEGLIEKSQRDAHDRLVNFTNDWIRGRGL